MNAIFEGVVEEARPEIRPRSWRSDRWVVAAWCFAILPIITATWNAIRNHWRPIGDNAFIAMRANDVLSSHHPWLGTWSSASIDAGTMINHPGPLLFDSLWPTVKVFGGQVGVALGVALVNMLAVTTITVFSFRRGGRRTALAMLVATAAVIYTMGSALLFDPWNPHILMLVCMAMLVTAWGIALGDRWALPVYIALASYSLQTHLGYAYFVPGVLAAAFATGWLVARTCPGGSRWLPQRRTLVISVLTGVVLWSQPLWEQFTGPGEGNMGRLLGAGGTGPKIGPGLATRLISDVFTGAPFTPRTDFMASVPGFVLIQSDQLKPLPAPPTPWAVVILLVLAGVLVLLARAAVRRCDRLSLGMLGLSFGALLVALGSLTVMPISPLGPAAHQMRWLWPITWFTWTAIAVSTIRWVIHAAHARESTLRPAQIATGATAVAMFAVAAISVLAVPTFVQPAGPAARLDQIPMISALSSQLDTLEGRGTIYVDTTNEPFLDNVSAAVMAELQHRGVDFTVGPEWLVRQLGEGRRSTGNEGTTVVLPRDDAALDLPEGARLEALVTPLTQEEQDELVALRDAAAGAGLDDAQQQQLQSLLEAAVGSVAVISLPVGSDEFVPLPAG
jgi:hypothetical protein